MTREEILNMDYEELEKRFLSMYGTASSPTKAATHSCNECGKICKKLNFWDVCPACEKKLLEAHGEITTVDTDPES